MSAMLRAVGAFTVLILVAAAAYVMLGGPHA